MEGMPSQTWSAENQPPEIILPGDRSQWPRAALLAYRELLRELDRWCRQHDWPAGGNPAVAEEAVRRSW